MSAGLAELAAHIAGDEVWPDFLMSGVPFAAYRISCVAGSRRSRCFVRLVLRQRGGDADKKLDSKRKEFIRDVHKRAGSVCFGRV